MRETKHRCKISGLVRLVQAEAQERKARPRMDRNRVVSVVTAHPVVMWWTNVP